MIGEERVYKFSEMLGERDKMIYLSASRISKVLFPIPDYILEYLDQQDDDRKQMGKDLHEELQIVLDPYCVIEYKFENTEIKKGCNMRGYIDAKHKDFGIEIKTSFSQNPMFYYSYLLQLMIYAYELKAPMVFYLYSVFHKEVIFFKYSPVDYEAVKTLLDEIIDLYLQWDENQDNEHKYYTLERIKYLILEEIDNGLAEIHEYGDVEHIIKKLHRHLEIHYDVKVFTVIEEVNIL